jgi:hypothetical protein
VKMKQFALLGINCWVNYMKQVIENKNKNKKVIKEVRLSHYTILIGGKICHH